jgi:hypothetical protein
MADNRLDRRTFIQCLSVLGAVSVTPLFGLSSAKEAGQSLRLWDPLSTEERQALKNSKMAGSILQYSNKRFSCAESLLMASMEFLGKPREWASLAGGFGGGLGQRDLCGLLTAGIMSIGVAAGIYCQNRRDFQEYIRKRRTMYWQWWQARSPIHCREMRIQYDRPGYFRMVQRIAAQLEQLLAPEKS